MSEATRDGLPMNLGKGNVTADDTIGRMACGHPGWTPGRGKPRPAWLAGREPTSLRPWGPPPSRLATGPSPLRGGPLLRRLLRARGLSHCGFRRGYTLGLDARPGTRGPPRPGGSGGRAGRCPPLIDRAVGGPESAGALSRWRLPPRPSLGRLGPALAQGTGLNAPCPIRQRMGLCWLAGARKLQFTRLPFSS